MGPGVLVVCFTQPECVADTLRRWGYLVDRENGMMIGLLMDNKAVDNVFDGRHSPAS